MTEAQSGLSRLAGVSVRLAALWLLTGASFKLFAGSPKMLPELVRSWSPMSWSTTFHVVIAIELALVMVALLKPRWGWMPITALFTFFLVILAHQMSLGAASCGCLGDSITIPPWVMMLIDGTLLAFVLATKPWSTLPAKGLSTALLAVSLVVALSAPWIVLSGRTGDPIVPPLATHTDPNTTTGTPANTGTRTAPPPKIWIEMDPTRWVGKSIYDVAEFTKWVPADSIPTDGRIVLWRQGCDHCAKHLRDMANEKEATAPILLVQVQDDLKSARAVDALPTGAHVTALQLPDNAEGLFSTPVEIRVTGGVVQAALYEEDFEKLEGH